MQHEIKAKYYVKRYHNHMTKILLVTDFFFTLNSRQTDKQNITLSHRLSNTTSWYHV